MKTKTTKMLTAATFLMALTAFSGQAKADVYDHIDQLACSIQVQSRALLKETTHYRHTPGYRQLVSEASGVYRLATHIHDVTHFEGNLRHLKRDVRDLDRCFHRLENLFDQIEHDAEYGDGHVHGNTRHVKRALKSIERSIHHLQSDLRKLQRPSYERPTYQRPTYHRPTYERPTYRRPTYTRPVYRPTAPACDIRPSSGYRGYSNYGNRSNVGFSIGGGSSKLTFRF